ncbi:MAG TPA: glycosyltransferase family A protein [Hyphomicrobiaceae bacterium]|nr:glycosyltransferase family A protein [Hyphomicrobiaceae bacterium]
MVRGEDGTVSRDLRSDRRTDTVSVILPNYNHARYLEQSISAVLRQTRPAEQVVIIDDGSTDGSLQLIERLVAGNPTVEVIRNARPSGVVSAMNQGLALARGTLVAMLAADDMVFPTFFERSTALLNQHPDAAFSCALTEIWDEDGEVTGSRPFLRPALRERYFSPDATRQLLRKGDNYFLAASSLFRYSKIAEMGGFKGSLASAADGFLQRRMAVRWGFCFIPAPLAAWRLHGANYSQASVTNPESLNEMLAQITRQINAEPAGLFPDGYAELFERRLRFGAGRLIASRLPADPVASDQIAKCIKAGSIERRWLATLARTGRLSPRLMIAWLALRNRPFSPWWTLAESTSLATGRRRGSSSQ